MRTRPTRRKSDQSRLIQAVVRKTQNTGLCVRKFVLCAALKDVQATLGPLIHLKGGLSPLVDHLFLPRSHLLRAAVRLLDLAQGLQSFVLLHGMIFWKRVKQPVVVRFNLRGGTPDNAAVPGLGPGTEHSSLHYGWVIRKTPT